MKRTFRIAEISFGRSDWDAAYEFRYGDETFEVQRFGANFSVENIKALILRYRNDVDAFAVTSLPPVVQLEQRSYVHRQYLDVMSTPASVPICDGSGLREISNLTQVLRAIEDGRIDPEQGVFFPAGLLSIELVEFFRHRYRGKVHFGDAYVLFGLPLILKPFPGLKTLTKLALNFTNFKDLRSHTPLAETPLQKMSRAQLSAQVERVQYVVGDMGFLILFDTAVEFIRGKDVVIWSHHPQQEEELRKYGPRSVINLFPPEFSGISPYMNYAVMDAVLRLSHGRASAMSLEEWERLLCPDARVRSLVRRYAFTRSKSAQAKMTDGFRRVQRKVRAEDPPDFAFIVHALSHGDFERVPVLGSALKFLPERLHDGFDRVVAKAPPIVYGKVRHVISEATGREVNGILYGLFSTPKVMRDTLPEVTYAQIEKICNDAASRGAKIIGLGAYTKVIGDSGITINQNSPIPVTTGNSLSASATLWGLYEVVSKMGLQKLDENGHVLGTAMVIGATGSIGSVSAKLLAIAFNRVVLVAPRLNRLRELATEIRKIAPHCEVLVTTNANDFAAEADALVTATSAFDQQIIEVERLKTGCVVCDCSRPLDFSIKDARKRPDVLIIESGEVVLPGPVDIGCDLGLPGKTVYACLAETALLALEERYESFTLGRDIDWVKVKEIYKLARRHGVKLSAIQGHMGLITDREIELTRQLALAKLMRPK